jgi:hypothetical protein
MRPFNPDVKRLFDNRFIKISANIHYDIYNPHAGSINNKSQDLGKRNFYGLCTVSDDLTIINLTYNSVNHPFFTDNFKYDSLMDSSFTDAVSINNYKLQIIQPGIIVLFNFLFFDENNIEVGDDQFQTMGEIDIQSIS